MVSAGSIFAAEPAAADKPVRFQAVDIYVDSKAQPLAAYQLEFSAPKGRVKIAGIEGGEHPAFNVPPFYDPKAMQQERVIIAAFNTAAPANLPKGRTRVATIHVQITGEEPPQYAVTPQAAASAEGKRLSVEATIQERKTE
jgi:hypothetical protein